MPAQREPPALGRPADDLVDGVVAPDVLAHDEELPVRVEERRGVEAARRGEGVLRLAQARRASA